MKFSSDIITFSDVTELVNFIEELSLMGQLKLSDPIEDNKGMILVREDLFINNTILVKLKEHEKQFIPKIKVFITKEVLKQLNGFITKRILARLDDRENAFIRRLYENTHHNYRDYIRHSFQNRKLSLLIYQLCKNETRFFDHIAIMGLLSMGVVMQRHERTRMLHRYSFQVGFCADLALSENGEWYAQYENEVLFKKNINDCAALIESLEFPARMTDVIRNQNISISNPEKKHKSSFRSPIEEMDEDSHSADITAGDIMDEIDADTVNILTEALNITRYLNYISQKITEQQHFAEELVYNLAYNAARGYFMDELVLPVLKKFREYEDEIKRLISIAHLEEECLHSPSAWAYPKPRSTQILCKNSELACPLIVRGWDIHVIASQEAFGWIGTRLDEGNYQKCSLADKLPPEISGGTEEKDKRR